MNDVFGNPIDDQVGYARGGILKSAADEETSRLRVMRLIRRKIAERDVIYNMTGVCRYSYATPESRNEDWEHFSRERANQIVVEWFGGNQDEHSSLTVTRLTSLNIAAILTLARSKHVVLHIGASDSENAKSTVHPSVVFGARLANARLIELKGIEDLDKVDMSQVALVIITPFVETKLHLELGHLTEVVDLAHAGRVPVYVDDSHSALRVHGLGEPKALQLGADLAADSTDKHIRGPLAGIMAGRKELVQEIGLTASSLGALATPYWGYDLSSVVCHALEEHKAEEVRDCLEFNKSLYLRLLEVWKGAIWNAYSGVGLSMEGITSMAMNKLGHETGFVPCEVSTAFATALLDEENILAFGAINLPGIRRDVRLMIFPDGLGLGAEKVESSILRALASTVQMLNDRGVVRKAILGS